MMAIIERVETQLNELKSFINGTPITSSVQSTPKKSKKAVQNPNAPKKPNNVWITFTTRVTQLLKTASTKDGADLDHFKGPATMVKSFCKMLKETKPYEAWEDSEILEAFESWERPANPVRTKKGSSSASSAASVSSVNDDSIVDETAVSQIVADAPVVESVAPVEEPKKSSPKVKNVITFTMEELTDFYSKEFDGVEYGINKRGDVMDNDKKFIGSYNSKKNTINNKAKKPSDWESIMSSMNEEE